MSEDSARRRWLDDRSCEIGNEGPFDAWEAGKFAPSDLEPDDVDSVVCACEITCDPRDPDHVAHRNRIDYTEAMASKYGPEPEDYLEPHGSESRTRTDFAAQDEAMRYCQPHGEEHDDLTCLRLLAEASLAGGRWSASTDSCDCGNGYGCSHGTWVHAVHVEKSHSQGEQTNECDPENALDAYRHDRSELSDFTWDEAHYIVAAQPSIVLALLDRLAAAERLTQTDEADRD